MTGAGFGASSTSGHEHSITRSGISLGKITINDEAAQQALTGQGAAETIASTDRNVLIRDVTNGLTKKWDGQKLMREQAAKAKIIAAFGQQAGEAIGTYCEGKVNALQQQADAAIGAEKEALLAEAEKWSEGGTWRISLHTVAGGLGGRLQGALGAAGAASAAPLLDEFQDNIASGLESAGMDAKAARIAAQMTSGTVASGLGLASGGKYGAMAAVNVDFNNRQLSPHEYSSAIELSKNEDIRRNLSRVEGREVSSDELEGRVAAEILRNSDDLESKKSGAIHDYKLRSIVGCKNLNCDGFKNDARYMDPHHNENHISAHSNTYAKA